jgi:hypothetical protein
VEGAKLRVYVEAIEITTDENENPDFVRIDVTGKTDSEINEIIEVVKELMAGTSFDLYIHYCRHDESGPCSRKELEH